MDQEQKGVIMAYSKAQNEANKRWQQANRERNNYLKKKSTAKSFIRMNATLEDLEDLENLISEVKSSKFS